MYQYLRNMLNLADLAGNVEEVDMSEWVKNVDRIHISGKAKNGGSFNLELKITKPEVEKHD